MSSLSFRVYLNGSGDYKETLSRFFYAKCFLPVYPYYAYRFGNTSLWGGRIRIWEYIR